MIGGYQIYKVKDNLTIVGGEIFGADILDFKETKKPLIVQFNMSVGGETLELEVPFTRVEGNVEGIGIVVNYDAIFRVFSTMYVGNISKEDGYYVIRVEPFGG